MNEEKKLIEDNNIIGLKNDFDKYGGEQPEIITLIHLFKKRLMYSQSYLVELSKTYKRLKLIKSYPIRSEPALSNSKKNEDFPENTRKKIKECLEEMLSINGIEIEKYPSQDNLSVIYYENGKTPPDIKEEEVVVEKKEGKKSTQKGTLNSIKEKPLDQEEIKTHIKNTYKLRILQSRFYNSKQTLQLIRNSLEEGNLCEVQILLGQPYSRVSEERAATSKTQPKFQFNSIRNELEITINEIIRLAKEFDGKPKGNSDDVYKIELRMYYFGNPITLYQCLDKNGQNQVVYMGVFWRNGSAYESPHIEIKNKNEAYIDSVESHFNDIWNDITQKSLEEFSWHHHLGEKKTIVINPQDDIDKLLKNLEKAYELKNFSKYSVEQPKWIHFRCIYYNFKDEYRSFLLQIDPNQGIARIKNTKKNNTYYGFVRKLYGNYSIVLHTILDVQDRVIYINIPTDAEGFKKDEIRYASYNNNAPKSGAPYNQVMLLQLLAKEEDFFDKHNELDIKYYFPNFRNRKIKIRKEESTDIVRKKYKISGDYVYRFNIDERAFFYELLKEEISAAKSQVYFLGYGPTNFPNAADSFMHNYLNSHKECLKNKVKFHRILLKNKVSLEFKNFLKEVKSNEEYGRLYNIYLTNEVLPIIGDLVIIDPRSPERRKAFLIFMDTKKNQKENTPIKLEVFKEDDQVIKTLLNTAVEFINDIKIRKELVTLKEIELKLRVT